MILNLWHKKHKNSHTHLRKWFAFRWWDR